MNTENRMQENNAVSNQEFTQMVQVITIPLLQR